VTRVCYVVRWFTLQGLKLARVFVTLSIISDTCPLQSFSSNSTFIMLYMIHEMDVDYLVVGELINIEINDYNCMFSIGANL
jgi:hypothetical protein